MRATVLKATHEQTKAHNKQLILKTIYDHSQSSRADVARWTGLTRPTVSSTVAELIEEGLVEEVGQGQSDGGKPPILLRVVDGACHLIGLDLANSEFRGAVTDLRGKIIHRVSLPVQERDGAAALDLVYALCDQLLAAATSPLLGIGIGTPGLIDAQQGIVRKAVNLDWNDLPLRDLVATRYHAPVYVANDSHVAALAEYIFGQQRKTPNLVVVKVGRGVGAGIVLQGRLYHGDGSGAGEIGHVRVVEQGVRCRCGHVGCLETVTSSQAIVKQARQLAQVNPQSLLWQFTPTLETITTTTALDAFLAGDPAMQEVIAEVGRYLGVAVANLVGVLNIQKIVIAGSVARFGQPLQNAITQEMRKRAMAILADETTVALSTLAQDIVILGAAALLLTHELKLT
ncbi:MAG: ROK family transcriptional regulator [Caldilineaceae bacterium]